MESGDLESSLDRPLREGLPRGYRMRADAHYVEQLTEKPVAAPLRSIPVDDIDVDQPADFQMIAPLTKSVRQVGIVHPLLVRPADGRYQLIAGRKRLRAAQAAGLTAVPCFVHQIEPADIAALREADDLQVTLAPEDQRPRAADPAAAALEQLRHDLDVLHKAQVLQTTAQSTGSQFGLDEVVRAHLTRARWMANAAASADSPAGAHEPEELLGVIMSRAVAEFEPEARLRRLACRQEIAADVFTAAFRPAGIDVAIFGGLIAAAATLAASPNASLSVNAARRAEFIRIAIVHAPIVPDTTLEGRFFDSGWLTRPGGTPACLGATTWARCAAWHRGHASYEVEGREGRLIMTLMP